MGGSPLSGAPCAQTELWWDVSVSQGSLWVCLINDADLVAWIASPTYLPSSYCQSSYEQSSLSGMGLQPRFQPSDPDKSLLLFNSNTLHNASVFAQFLWWTSVPATTGRSTTSSSTSSSDVSVGAVVGIVVGVVGGLCLIVAVIALICRKRRQQKETITAPQKQGSTLENPSVSMTSIATVSVPTAYQSTAAYQGTAHHYAPQPPFLQPQPYPPQQFPQQPQYTQQSPPTFTPLPPQVAHPVAAPSPAYVSSYGQSGGDQPMGRSGTSEVASQFGSSAEPQRSTEREGGNGRAQLTYGQTYLLPL